MTDALRRLERGLRDRYRIEREIGRGGMAVVYLAFDLKHDRPVALKLLRSEMAEQVGGERFLREIRTTAQLQHPGILALHDSGEVDGLFYYVMPFVEGESLRQRLTREQRLPLPDVARMAMEVGEALDYAHARGIVHRDVKPENILFSQGHAVIGDFGIARATGATGGEHLTEAGITLGTVGYMSPEQATAEPIDGRSDQYALACVVYEALAGEPPFVGPTGMAVVSRHLVEPAPPVRTLRPDASAHMEQAIRRAMAKEPAERFDTVVEFARALEADATGVSPSVAFTPTARSVAVLPFADLSQMRDHEYFCDGLSEALQESLSRVEGLRVVSRTSAFAFKGKRLDVREIGKRLNVATLLEGSVQATATRLRVSVTLTNATDGYQLWSERYDRAMADVFDLQDDIARTVVRRLLPKLSGEVSVELAPTATEDVEAYQLYLKGRHVWNRRTAEALRQSIGYFHHAIERDSGFALAQAGLADAHAMLGIYGALPPAEAWPLAKSFAEEALRQTPNLAEALTTRGCVRAVFEWDWAGAEADFRQALAANPRYATAHQWYAVNCLMPLGRFPEAGEHLDRALDLDPLSPAIGATLGLLAYLERHHEEAIQRYREVLELDPRFALADYFLGLALTAQGEYREAVARLTHAAGTGGRSAEVVAALAVAEALAGRNDAAQALLGELESASRTRYVSPVLMAQVHAALGRRDPAFEALAEGLRARAAEMIWLGVRPTFDPLRDDPRFEGFLQRIGLPYPHTRPAK